MRDHFSTQNIESFCVLICALNEADRIESVIHSCLEQGPALVLVLDDGSSDETAERARNAGAEVIQFTENQGKGACLRKGFEVVQERGFDAVVVVDGDGQHDPSEIPQFLDAYERTGIPVLIGNRMANTSGMPLIRRWTNRAMAFILNRLVKIYVADPPCGYRFYHTDVLPFITSSEARFAFEFDVLIHAALRRIRVDSVRVSTIYNRRKRSHVAPIRDAILLARVVRLHFGKARGGKGAD